MTSETYDTKSIARPEEIEALYVQTAHAMSYDDDILTLQMQAMF